MKTSNALFNRNSNLASIGNFQKYELKKEILDNVRGGADGGGDIIYDDDPHTPPQNPEISH